MEDHPLVGHLVAPAIAIIARLNPAVFTLENVTSYAGTASAAILRHQLRDLGYVVHERKFLATEFGDLEARERWCMVAVTKGIDLDLDEVLPAPFAVRTLNDILEPLEAVADRWSEMQGLKDKEVRDLEAGKNFKMQVYDGGESSIGTLTKGLAKNRSTDPKIRHATNPDLLRVPTVREHARAKGVDERLVEGLTFTVGHEVLGQGICAAPFRALFRYLARELRASTAKLNKRVFNQFKHEQESLLVAA
jgi:DNA (cytosine-5)-methyltransferase 1